MDFNLIINQLDQLYDQDRMDEAYDYLVQQIQEATKYDDHFTIIALLSELVSHCRVTAKFEEGNKLANQLLQLIPIFQLNDTLHEATAVMNIATFYRVQGRYMDSLKMYQRCEELYQVLLNEKDERYISFYNNIALLYQETGNIQKSIEYSLKALSLQDDDNKRGITYTNLCQMYYENGEEKKGDEALQKAFDSFEKAGYPDSHYLAAYSMKANQDYRLGKYEEAIRTYEFVLDGIEKIYGQNHDYRIVLANLEEVKKASRQIKGLDLCERYYDAYGKEMLEKKYPDYIQYMCIGLFGYGSDCLGYDDLTSQDHDFGPGFLILLPKDIYDLIGKQLQKDYDALPNEYLGYQRKVYKEGRVGVVEIEEFFGQFIDEKIDYLSVDEYDLLCCTNGKIFEDHYGKVTKIREKLNYYPKKEYDVRLAQTLVKVSQCGQYNYFRMKQRNSSNAYACLQEMIDYAIHAYYLLHHQYEPYYKWKLEGIKHKEYKQLLIDLYSNQEVEANIQKICEMIIMEVKQQFDIQLDSIFVEDYGNYIMEVFVNGQ